MKDQSDFEEFKQQLVDHYTFPTLYLFKFIVPADKTDDFNNLFHKIQFDTKRSKTGKYISFSKKHSVKSSDEVIEIYKKAYTIDGIISL
jgi:hypothetical protein